MVKCMFIIVSLQILIRKALVVAWTRPKYFENFREIIFFLTLSPGVGGARVQRGHYQRQPRRAGGGGRHWGRCGGVPGLGDQENMAHPRQTQQVSP